MRTFRRARLAAPARWSLRAAALVAVVAALLSSGGANAAPLCWQTWYGYQNYKTQYQVQVPELKEQTLIATRVDRPLYKIQTVSEQRWSGWVTGYNKTQWAAHFVTNLYHHNKYSNRGTPAWEVCGYAFGAEDGCGGGGHNFHGYAWQCHYNEQVWNNWDWYDEDPSWRPNEYQAYWPVCSKTENGSPRPYFPAKTYDVDRTRVVPVYNWWDVHWVPTGQTPAPANGVWAWNGQTSVERWFNAPQWLDMPAGVNSSNPYTGDYYWDGSAPIMVFDHWGAGQWVDTANLGAYGYEGFNYIKLGQPPRMVRTGRWQAPQWMDNLPGGQNGPNAYVFAYYYTGITRRVPDGFDRYAAQIPPGTWPTGKTKPFQVACVVRPT